MHDYGPYETGVFRDGILRMEGESEQAYTEALMEDYTRNLALLTQAGQRSPFVFTFPLGFHDSLSDALLIKLGNKVTVTTEVGVNDVVIGLPQSLYSLKRLNVIPNEDSSVLLDLIATAMGH